MLSPETRNNALEGSSGSQGVDLIQWLIGEDSEGQPRYSRFDFFRLVRGLERSSRVNVPVGCALTLSEEVVLFGQKPFLDFAPRAIQDVAPSYGTSSESPMGLFGIPDATKADLLERFGSLERLACASIDEIVSVAGIDRRGAEDIKRQLNGETAPRVWTYFFGMWGPNGPLPNCWSEFALQRQMLQRNADAPRVDARPLLHAAHFQDFGALVGRLKRADDPILRQIFDGLTPSTQRMVRDVAPSKMSVGKSREILMQDLATVLSQQVLNGNSEKARSAAVGRDLLSENLLLLGQKYPDCFSQYVARISGRWDYGAGDFTDIPKVIRRLRDGEDATARVLWNVLRQDFQGSLRTFAPGSFQVQPLLGTFLDELNHLLDQKDLAVQFAGHRLPVEKDVLNAAAETLDLIRKRNRRILDAVLGAAVVSYAARSDRDFTLQRFLDVFHHRFISFFYRAWAIHQKSVDYEMGERGVLWESTSYRRYFASVSGIGLTSLQGRDSIPDQNKYYYTGLLARHAKGGSSLATLLAGYFGVPARVQEFVGRWIWLPPESVCKLGENRAAGHLGVNCITGGRMWDCQLGFRIVLGPVSLRDYERLLPGGNSFRQLQDWVKFFAGLAPMWDLQLVLKRDEVPTSCLGRYGALGRTTWMKTKALPRDADQFVCAGNN